MPHPVRQLTGPPFHHYAGSAIKPNLRIPPKPHLLHNPNCIKIKCGQLCRAGAATPWPGEAGSFDQGAMRRYLR
jgi:hypothetical protein